MAAPKLISYAVFAEEPTCPISLRVSSQFAIGTEFVSELPAGLDLWGRQARECVDEFHVLRNSEPGPSFGLSMEECNCEEDLCR